MKLLQKLRSLFSKTKPVSLPKPDRNPELDKALAQLEWAKARLAKLEKAYVDISNDYLRVQVSHGRRMDEAARLLEILAGAEPVTDLAFKEAWNFIHQFHSEKKFNPATRVVDLLKASEQS